MEWPPELDALVVAPEHHENERVRVLDTRFAAGDSVPVHTHRWPSLYYVISSAQFVRHDDAGELLLDARELEQPFDLPPTVWSEPLSPHSLENVDERELRLIQRRDQGHLRGF